MDIAARCHRCTSVFEVIADGPVCDEVYAIPIGQLASCPWCGYVHQAGVELLLTDEAVR